MSNLTDHAYVTFEASLEAEAVREIRHEWLDGVVYAMSRETSVGRRRGRAANRSEGKRVVYGSGAMLYIAETKLSTYADAVVACGPLATYRVAKLGEAIIHPTLIVEVLSPSTEPYDRGDKLARALDVGRGAGRRKPHPPRAQHRCGCGIHVSSTLRRLPDGSLTLRGARYPY